MNPLDVLTIALALALLAVLALSVWTGRGDPAVLLGLLGTVIGFLGRHRIEQAKTPPPGPDGTSDNLAPPGRKAA